MDNKSEYKYLIVVDFEANCDNPVDPYPQEITEFPALPINLSNNEIEYKKVFHHYCKIDKKLTAFATKLTKITQDTLNKSLPFKEVLKLFDKWLHENKFIDDKGNTNFLLVTCGDWDFKTAFVNQCKYSNIKVPKYTKEWCNMKDVFRHKYNVRRVSMLSLLDYFNLELDGTHHSGIDDTKNIAKICVKMLEDDTPFYVTNYY
jgi:inhibitor of KinA sporulation pathway (predicted exonuclease)